MKRRRQRITMAVLAAAFVVCLWLRSRSAPAEYRNPTIDLSRPIPCGRYVFRGPCEAPDLRTFSGRTVVVPAGAELVYQVPCD